MPAIYLKGQPCFTESIDSSQLPSGRTIVEVTKKFAEYVVNTNLEDFPPEAIGACLTYTSDAADDLTCPYLAASFPSQVKHIFSS